MVLVSTAEGKEDLSLGNFETILDQLTLIRL
jgi:hypothetical protein